MITSADLQQKVVFNTKGSCHKECGVLKSIDNQIAIIEVFPGINVARPVYLVWLMSEYMEQEKIKHARET